jgi:hypothetical protein
MKKGKKARKGSKTPKIVRSKAMSFTHDLNEARSLEAARKAADKWRKLFVG